MSNKRNRHVGNGQTAVAEPEDREEQTQAVVPAKPTPAAVVEVEDEPVEEASSGEQLALQLINSIDGDMRLTIASAAFASGQKRLKRLKQEWSKQIEELKADWSDDDAELLKLAITSQKATILQLFVSMNPAAFASRTVRDKLAATVDKLIDATVARIVAPEGDGPK